MVYTMCAEECGKVLQALTQTKNLQLGEIAEDARANETGLRSPDSAFLLSAEEAFFWYARKLNCRPVTFSVYGETLHTKYGATYAAAAALHIKYSLHVGVSLVLGQFAMTTVKTLWCI
jgi:hypothetical protein